jgi:hypothetical protein
MDPKIRADFLNRARDTYMRQLQNYNTTATGFKNQALRQDLNPENIIRSAPIPLEELEQIIPGIKKPKKEGVKITGDRQKDLIATKELLEKAVTNLTKSGKDPKKLQQFQSNLERLNTEIEESSVAGE